MLENVPKSISVGIVESMIASLPLWVLINCRVESKPLCKAAMTTSRWQGWGLPIANDPSRTKLAIGNICLSLQFELLLQSANHYLKLAWFYNRFVVGADKGKIIRTQIEGESSTLARFQIDFGKTLKPFSGGR